MLLVDEDFEMLFRCCLENFSANARKSKTANIMEKMSRRTRMVEKRARFIEIVISLLRIE